MVTGVPDFYLSKLFKEFFPESCESVKTLFLFMLIS